MVTIESQEDRQSDILLVKRDKLYASVLNRQEISCTEQTGNAPVLNRQEIHLYLTDRKYTCT